MTILIFLLVLGISFTLSKLKDDIQRIELQLNKLSNHLNLEEFNVQDLDKDLLEELTVLVNEDNQIQAVKRLRDETGLGLKKAKQLVDQIY